MTTPDIAAQCERLREALEGVTPGPWEAEDSPVHYAGMTRPVKNIYAADRLVGSAEYWQDEDGHDNAAFIALSREAVPVLLDTLERQAAEIERLRELLRCIRDTPANEFDAVNVANRLRAALTGEDA